MAVAQAALTLRDCETLLQTVLASLDRMSEHERSADSQSLSLAALHVQQAIELVNARRPLDS